MYYSLAEIENLPAIAYHGRQDARAKVSGGIDGEAGLCAETHSDAEEREEERYGKEPRRGRAVPLVRDGEEDDDEQERADELLIERIGEGEAVEVGLGGRLMKKKYRSLRPGLVITREGETSFITKGNSTDLIKECVHVCHIPRGVGAEEACGTRDSADTASALSKVNGMVIHAIGDSGAYECTEELCEDVERHEPPREVAEGSKGDCDLFK